MLLGCSFDVKKLPIKLPKFYEECFQIFAEYSTASTVSVDSLDNKSKAGIIIWNNKHICVDGKSVYRDALFKKGIITLEDLVSDNNDLRAVLCKYRLSSFGREKMKSLKISQKNGLYK